MRFSGLVTTAMAASSLASSSAPAKFVPVELTTPLNWVTGTRRPMDRFSANLTDYSAEGWAQFVLLQCTCVNAGSCTSSLTYQATNPGDTGGRFWFGFIFSGAPTTQKDYKRDTCVTDSMVYTISSKKSLTKQYEGSDL